MTVKWALAFLSTVFLTTFLVSAGNNPQTVHAPLWGALSPGEYRVGFRVIHRFDGTRTWRTTRRYEKEFSADLSGRPIRISVWYPAVVRQGQRPMHYEDYIKLPVPADFAELGALLERH